MRITLHATRRRVAAVLGVAVFTITLPVALAAPASAAPSGDVMLVPVLGRGGVPTTGVAAVVATVTAVDPTSPAYVTAFECGQGLPPTSNVNVSSDAVPNTAVVPIETGGMLCVYRSAPVHVLVDVTGWIATGSVVTTVTPTRALDTRTGTGAPAGRVLPGTDVRVQITGADVPAGAVAVVANVTVTGATEPGYVTVAPCDAGDPGTSNVNFRPGIDVANLGVIALGADGAVCVTSSAATHVLIDVSAWLPAGASVDVPTPRRLADTRGTSPVGPAQPLRVRVTDSVASSVMLNVTSTQQEAAGYLTVYPCTTTVPETSAVNFVPGTDAAASVLATPAADGTVCVHASAVTDVIVDLQAVTFAGSGVNSVAPVRLADTRRPVVYGAGTSSWERTLTEDQIATSLTIADVAQLQWGELRIGDLSVEVRTLTSSSGPLGTFLEANRGSTSVWRQVLSLPGEPAVQSIIRAHDDTTVYVVKISGFCDATGCWWMNPVSTLVAFDLATGQQRWAAELGPGTWYRFTADAGSVLVSGTDAVISFDAATGARRWSRAGLAGGNEFGVAAVDPGRVVVSEGQYSGGRVLAEMVRRLDPLTGSTVWSQSIGIHSTCQGPSQILHGPAVDLAVNSGIVTGLDAATGAFLWRSDLDTTLGAVIGDQRTALTADGDLVVLLSTYNQATVARIDATTGTVEWTWRFRNEWAPNARTINLTLQLAVIGEQVVLGNEYRFLDDLGFEGSRRDRVAILLDAGTGRQLV